MRKKIIVIGSGFAGLAAACFLGKAGHEVTVLEKNSEPGGRARVFKENGFLFDMGPSWYWMPDVFERFFNSFDRSVSDFYQLIRLDPSYKIFTKSGPEAVPSGVENLKKLFESREVNGGKKLVKFLAEARVKYETGMQEMVYKPSLSFFEFISLDTIKKALRIQLFTPFHRHVRKYFTDPLILQLLEFPVLFLGAKPEHTPALYSLMNYADMQLGTWYPMGGMGRIVEGMVSLAKSFGVQFRNESEVISFSIENGLIREVNTGTESFETDGVVAAADYQHIEQKILPKEYRKYSQKYWDERVMAPSCLIYFLGIDKRVDGLEHHNLFFDEDFNRHAEEIYDHPQWPNAPLFYVCCPSKTDPSTAPSGCENLFILVPVASGLNDNDQIRKQYLDQTLGRIEKQTGEKLKERIIYMKSYAHNDFLKDYNSFKGNAYGLANTLHQTAFMKPSIKNSKVKNLVFAGQLTVPGPGVPPSLISGEIAAHELIKMMN